MSAGIFVAYDGGNNPVMRFEYADARMPFAMTTGSGRYFLAYDQVGSLRVVADGSGNPVKQIDYDSFGNVFYDSDPDFAVPFGFAGGLHDRDTGLVRFGYRDYDPDTGRWTAKDPIGFNGGDSDLYGYCLGDPVNFIDPLGLENPCSKTEDSTFYMPLDPYPFILIWDVRIYYPSWWPFGFGVPTGIPRIAINPYVYSPPFAPPYYNKHPYSHSA